MHLVNSSTFAIDQEMEEFYDNTQHVDWIPELGYVTWQLTPNTYISFSNYGDILVLQFGCKTLSFHIHLWT